MTGLLLGLVLSAWALICLALAGRTSQAIAHPVLRQSIKCLVFLALLALPLADEIYSYVFFSRLCEAKAKLVVLDQNLTGKTIWYAGVRSQPTRIGLLRGLEKDWTYVVAVTETPAFRHSSIHVQGGRLMQVLGISETSSPLLFSDHCDPVNAADLPRLLNVVIVDKPNS